MTSSVALFPLAYSTVIYPLVESISHNVHGNPYTVTARFEAYDQTLALHVRPAPWVDILQYQR
jgi:hypothetical protein